MTFSGSFDQNASFHLLIHKQEAEIQCIFIIDPCKWGRAF